MTGESAMSAMCREYLSAMTVCELAAIQARCRENARLAASRELSPSRMTLDSPWHAIRSLRAFLGPFRPIAALSLALLGWGWLTSGAVDPVSIAAYQPPAHHGYHHPL